MSLPDLSNCTFVGRTSNVEYYVHQDNILLGIVLRDVPDTETTAASNVAFHNTYFQRHGPGVLVIFLDQGTKQNRAARKVYDEQTDPKAVLGVCMVSDTLLGRALGALFIGLNRPSIPIKLVGSFPLAIEFANNLLGKP